MASTVACHIVLPQGCAAADMNEYLFAVLFACYTLQAKSTANVSCIMHMRVIVLFTKECSSSTVTVRVWFQAAVIDDHT